MNMYNTGFSGNSDKSYSTTWGGNGAVSADYRQKLRALQEFRRAKEEEQSEFAAEFRRLSAQGEDRLGIVEAGSLAAVLAGCEAMLGAGQVRLVWLLPLGGGRIAACLGGDLTEDVVEQGRLAVADRDGSGTVFVLDGVAWEVRHAVLNLGCIGAHGRWCEQDKGDKGDKADKADKGDKFGEAGREYGRAGKMADMKLLEMTDEELRRLIVTLAPDKVPVELNLMHKEELVDLCSRLRQGIL